MTDLYLILHKVRGEPAFDIACKLQIGDEEGWIIPTSGHRAYPVWAEPFIAEVHDTGIVVTTSCNSIGFTPLIPDDWPDHYAVTCEPTKADSAAADDLLASLGLKSNSAKGYLRR